MAEVKYIKIGKKQYKKWNVILFFCFLIIVYILLTVFMLFNLKAFIGYKPETKQELEKLIKNRYIPLSMIDTSRITDMSWLFHGGILVDYEGIESWDVSNVENMEGMFFGAGNINADLSSWDISKVKNMQYMFGYVQNISKEQINWKMPENIKYYGMFRGTELENDPPVWFINKNEFKVKYYPKNASELGKLLADKNILAGEIDVQQVDDLMSVVKDIKRKNQSYFAKYNKLRKLYYQFKRVNIDDVTLEKEYEYKTKELINTGFYDELEDIQQIKHDDYAGIEFWNVPNISEIMYIINMKG